ncbi:hypothetical protein A0J61_03962 [Choanephora cucurbitarum]|uniref:Uncharacterized protein n=1 Tax=Choanephora cucurbitarum TaxID=101091 RepID=A0A1C7NFX2_9FUNG|nr:hypothetical protein A0J61_03962 [Choanephora cucurbitarum]
MDLVSSFEHMDSFATGWEARFRMQEIFERQIIGLMIFNNQQLVPLFGKVLTVALFATHSALLALRTDDIEE